MAQHGNRLPMLAVAQLHACSPTASGGVQSKVLLTNSLTVHRLELRAQEEFTCFQGVSPYALAMFGPLQKGQQDQAAMGQ